MKSELTFEEYARQLADLSDILPDDAISGYIAMNKMQPIMLFSYRIAAFAARDLQNTSRVPVGIDDTDFIDAVQECILHVPEIVKSWSKNPTHKFSTYVNMACRNIISDYLWTLVKGGTGSQKTDAQPTDQLWELNDEECEEEEIGNDVAESNQEPVYEYPPQGFRDPLEELIAAEDEDRALRALMQPLATPQATQKRNIRARKLLGLTGVSYRA